MIMVKAIKVNGKTIKNMVKENTAGPMVIHIKDNTKKIKDKDTASLNIIMDKATKVNGKIV